MHDHNRQLTTAGELNLAAARAAQKEWSARPMHQRLRLVRELRHLIAAAAPELATAAAAVNQRPLAEKLVSEVLPLADACKWLERSAAGVLAPRRSGNHGQPFWLRGFSFEVHRQPFGFVLVIGPGNYPLFLPAVQALHALAAGNAVVLKPAPRTGAVAMAFAQLVYDAGFDPALFTILPESIDAARDAIAQGVDKVIFTGSSENGSAVAEQLAPHHTPAVMELSGEDAVLVFADADIDLVVRALGFGTHLNGGETCMRPKRLIVVEAIADELLGRLQSLGRVEFSIERVADEATAVARAEAHDYALGVSIFSRDVAKAQSIAPHIKSGFVLINDLIAPTADPRLPFGGVKKSGFGVTRGDEGLLEMTFPHVVGVRRGKFYRHFDETSAGDAHIFFSYILAAHGRNGARLGAFRKLAGALTRRIRNERAPL
ncbi:MAG: aldehyde dehydrogenase family protein [Chthoniobacterales bacterium]|nr:aldehyde dehydrogenase family protein [Chthoniobacterales bacterium]